MAVTSQYSNLTTTSEELEEGIFNIPTINLIAETAQTVLSERGAYLFVFSSSATQTERYGMYIVTLHASGDGGYVPVLEPSGMTVTFDTLSAGVCIITTSLTCRLRVIRISNSNY